MEEFSEEKINNYKYQPFHTRGCHETPKNTTHCDAKSMHCYCKLDSYEWLKNIDKTKLNSNFSFIEVRFKNGKKDFFKNSDNSIIYEVGDFVAVEGNPGHDIGIVSLTGETVKLQMRKKGIEKNNDSIKKVYRKAKLSDVEKWIAAVEMEDNCMKRAKKIISEINLEMKLNDIEYQGDFTKATFYYTAEERVDFRNLIKVLAEEFKVRIEMKQIGVRQEASRLGGIGTCGREICCSSWLTNFRSVSTQAARIQQLSLNPQKLAGQCSKLKCCLNYELDAYEEALKKFPSNEITITTNKGKLLLNKIDVFKETLWFYYENDTSNLFEFKLGDVNIMIDKNKKQQIVENIEEYAIKKEKKQDLDNNYVQEDISRFDENKKK